MVKVDAQAKKVYPNRALCLFLSRGPLDSPLRTEMNNKKGYPHNSDMLRFVTNKKRRLTAPNCYNVSSYWDTNPTGLTSSPVTVATCLTEPLNLPRKLLFDIVKLSPAFKNTVKSTAIPPRPPFAPTGAS